MMAAASGGTSNRTPTPPNYAPPIANTEQAAASPPLYWLWQQAKREWP